MNLSSKLVNYAQVNNGNLKLFTELDHSFLVGDFVYIIGGYYDNVSSMLNIYDQNTQSASLIKKKYKIIETTTNSITLDYPITISKLIYPYGNLVNKYGNAKLTNNLAYNNFTNNDLYKSVFVSKNININAQIVKGTINDGIFGNDNNAVNLSKSGNTANDLIINHIVSKNIKSKVVTINSKTPASRQTSKITVIEDLSSTPINNPYLIDTNELENNNNSTGYNYTERLYLDDTTRSIINGGNYDNPRTNFIYLNNFDSYGGKFGSNEYVGGCIFANYTFNNSTVKVFTSLNLTDFSVYSPVIANNCDIQTYYDINVISAEYTSNDFELKVYVDYNDVANKLMVDSIVNDVALTGIKHLDLEYTQFNTYYSINYKLIDYNYTYGDANSAYLLFNITTNLDWVNFKALYPINRLDFTNFKILPFNSIIVISDIQNSTLGIASVTLTLDKTNFIKNSNIKYGYYYNAVHDVNTKFDGIDNSLLIHYNITTQQYNSFEDTKVKTLFNNTFILSSTISGNIKNSNIAIFSVVQNSIIENSIFEQQTNIFNSTLKSNVRVNNLAYWSNVKIELGAVNTNLGERNTQFVTTSKLNEPENVFPNYNDYAINFNSIISTRSLDYYNNQLEIIKSGNYNNLLNMEAIAIQNIFVKNNGTDYNEFTGAEYLSIINYNKMDYRIDGNNVIWFPTFSKNESTLLFFGQTFAINDPIINKLNNNTIGTYNTFPEIIIQDLPVEDVKLDKVDDNFIMQFFNTPYHYNVSRYATDISFIAHKPVSKQAPEVQEYPDPDNNNILGLSSIKIITDKGNDVVFSNDNFITPAYVASGNHKLIFQLDKNLVDMNLIDATYVPACFIEIERIIKNYYDISSMPTQTIIDTCVYCPSFVNAMNGNEYLIDNKRFLSEYPSEFYIKNLNINNLTRSDLILEINNTDKVKVELTIEFWVTWYYKEKNYDPISSNPNVLNGYSGGYRTKHKIKKTIISTLESYDLITDNNEKIITNNNETISYKQ